MMSEQELRTIYAELRKKALLPVVGCLEAHIKAILEEEKRIDRVSVRAKDVESFMKKAKKSRGQGKQKYQHPLKEIQDQIGARIVVLYRADVEKIRTIVGEFFAPVEERSVEPESEAEFGYEGYHYVALLPTEVIPDELEQDSVPNFFELQIKTLFQHAWGEAGHDLAYKQPAQLTPLQRRQIAFTAAQAWGADMIFDELASTLLN